MSIRNTSAGGNHLTYEQQKQLITKAIEQRFPGTKFKEWSYYSMGHLLNFNDGGRGASDYADFLTCILLYIAAHELTASIKEEVGENVLENIKRLIRHFSNLSDSEDYYAFICHFHMLHGSVEKHDIVEAAKCYLTGNDREMVLAANKDYDY